MDTIYYYHIQTSDKHVSIRRYFHYKMRFLYKPVVWVRLSESGEMNGNKHWWMEKWLQSREDTREDKNDQGKQTSPTAVVELQLPSSYKPLRLPSSSLTRVRVQKQSPIPGVPLNLLGTVTNNYWWGWPRTVTDAHSLSHSIDSVSVWIVAMPSPFAKCSWCWVVRIYLCLHTRTTFTFMVRPLHSILVDPASSICLF